MAAPMNEDHVHIPPAAIDDEVHIDHGVGAVALGVDATQVDIDVEAIPKIELHGSITLNIELVAVRAHALQEEIVRDAEALLLPTRTMKENIDIDITDLRKGHIQMFFQHYRQH